MPRAYPPIWCQNEECKKCRFLECDERILNLFMPLKYPTLIFNERPRVAEITSIAIFLGYCQRLAKFFLLFPQHSPLSVVKDNFVSSYTGLPTTVSIQRILLDVLNHGDPEAPTDEVHRLRLLLGMNATKREKGFIVDTEKRVEVSVSKTELQAILEKVKKWHHDFFGGRIIDFEKTDNLTRCKYCFLEDCEQV